MAQSDTRNLSRFANAGPSAAASNYIKGISDAGERIQKLGAGLQAVKSEIRRREDVARASVKDSNAGRQGGANAKFLNKTASNMKDNIGGEGENAYDFSRVADIERFKNDVAQLNARIEKSEAVHKETMGNEEDGPDQNTWHGLVNRTKQAQTSGGATEGHVYEDLAGDGDFYDANSADMTAANNAEALLEESDIVENPDGTFTITKQDGTTIQANSFDEVLEEQRKSVLPKYERMPELSGSELVLKDKIGPNVYKTAEQAASAYVQKIMTPATRAAAERRAQTRTGSRERLQTPLSASSREKLMEKFGIDAPEDFTEQQYQYFEEMMQEWYDELDQDKLDKEARANRGGSGARADDLIGRIDQINYTMNEAQEGGDLPANEQTAGGEGVALQGESIRVGQITGGKAQQFNYNATTGEFEIIVQNSEGSEFTFEVPFSGTDNEGARAALMGALKISGSDLKRLMVAMRKKAEDRAKG